MFKFLLLLTVSLFFVSCSAPKPLVYEGPQKAFELEDKYILFALRCEQIGDYKSASILFNDLYTQSLKKEYLYRSLESDLHAKDNERLIQRVDAILLENANDVKALRLKIIALFELNRLDEAVNISIKLAQKTQEPNDYILVSDIYSKRQEYDLAIKYLEGAYVKEFNENILDRMAIILYVNLGRKKDAIAQLETHIRLHQSSKLICNRLAGFYSNDNNIDGLLSVYLKLYKLEKNEEIEKRIVQIYTYKKDYKALMAFLEQTELHDDVLLQLYSASNDYAKALPLADKLYQETLNVVYLGQSAIYEYELSKGKYTKEKLDSVVEKLQKVVSLDSSPVFMNYLGYILIDHSIDIKKGMVYIEKVLLLEPSSSFYLDSLAWGHYKLGECQKAKLIMNRVVTLEGGDDEEVISHVQKIDKCLEKKR